MHDPPTPHVWPDSLDVAALAIFLAAALLIPIVGYVFLVTDFRAYLRSLRRGLMRIVGVGQEAAWWAYRENPACLSALGLRLPCTEDELKRAYRERVKLLHPDRGGDKRRFLKLQAHFEAALKLVSEHQPHDSAGTARESSQA